MRVTCPACQTQYDLPAELAGALDATDRRLRCAQCGHVWLQQRRGVVLSAPVAVSAWNGPAEDRPPPPDIPIVTAPAAVVSAPEIEFLVDAQASALAASGPEPARARLGALPAGLPANPMANPMGRPPASPLVWAGWAGSVAVVLAVLALLWIGRGAVIRAVPATAPIYAALGGARAHPAAAPPRAPASH